MKVPCGWGGTCLMKDREIRSHDTIPWSISSKKAVRVKASISPKLRDTNQPLLPHQTGLQDKMWQRQAACPLTGCRSPPNVRVSRCPPCWWTPRRRSGPPTAWRVLSGPPVERRCRGTGRAPGADGQREPANRSKDQKWDEMRCKSSRNRETFEYVCDVTR